MNRMANRTGSRAGFGLALGFTLLALAGCQENSPPMASVTPVQPPKPELNLSATRGVPVADAGPVDTTQLHASRNLGSRGTSAFALLPGEVTFDRAQQTEFLLQTAGGWDLEIEPTLEIQEDPAPRVEPVPIWRLSGVIIGNGVIALLDTGRQTYEIRPGMLVPGTEWRVVSIDSERALLRRDTENVLPREFYVGLQGPIGIPGGGAQGGGAQGGGAQGGGTGQPGRRGGALGGGGNDIDR